MNVENENTGNDSNDKLHEEIREISENPIITGLLNSMCGMMAVLNEERQVVALNDKFLKMLGLEDANELMGLRLGEVMKCVHADEQPAGCSSTKYCQTCGAAISVVTTLAQDVPAERFCALTAKREGKLVDISLLVKSQPLKIESRNFVLLFIQDITLDQRRAAFERAFYHDINNMLNGLVQASELLDEAGDAEIREIIISSALKLQQEIAIQRQLSFGDSGNCNYSSLWSTLPLKKIFLDLERFYSTHSSLEEKHLKFELSMPDLEITTDFAALSRVLINMINNGLEATEKGGEVKLWVDKEGDELSFNVWNNAFIPFLIAQRIFQRNFSTKSQVGRGTGTYTMKLFGEEVLGGKVSFTSSREEGTVFTLKLPMYVAKSENE